MRVLLEAMRTWGVGPHQVLAIGSDPRDSQAACQAGILYIHGKHLFAMNPKDYIQHPGAKGDGLSEAPAPFDPATRNRSGQAAFASAGCLVASVGGWRPRSCLSQGDVASDQVLQID